MSEQPLPKGTGEEIFPLVHADLDARRQIGIEQYGEPLRAFNGRNPYRDVREEAQDLVLYLKQAELEVMALVEWAREAQLLLRTWDSAACQEHAAELDTIVTWRVEDQ
jgi:hypothetical protein